MYEFKGIKQQWQYEQGLIFALTESKTLVICDINRPIHGSADFTKEMADSNAHLIAAAPELLQACIDAFNFIETWVENAPQKQLDNLSDTLQNAINKANNLNQ